MKLNLVVPAIILSAIFAPRAAVAQPEGHRPTIGLALGGGSALGFAHVGILAWFEEHHVPIDMVAGTSIGGIVAGGYATGMSPDELRGLVDTVDWDLMFLGEPPYRERAFRRKEDRRQFPVRLEAGFKNGFRLPSGLDPAHQIGLFLSYLAFPFTEALDFDDLPTPFRAVATDLDKAESRALDHGSLAQALLATMAFPGVFPAVQIDGSTLADGGMLDMVPADVVRAMGADVVIGIDVGNQEEGGSLDALSQANRAISVMMESTSRESLLEANLLIKPDLGEFGSLDWRRSDAIANRGYEAAAAMSATLLQYAVSPSEWDAWARDRASRRRDRTFVPAALDIRGTAPQLEAFIRARLSPHLGKPLDFEALGRDLTWVTGSDHFDGLRYEASGPDRLLIVAREKSNGPPFVRFGLDLSTEPIDVAFGFRSRLIAPDVGKPSAELRADLTLGDRLGIGAEYYWPLAGTWMFLAPRAFASRERRDIFDDDVLVARVHERTAAVGGDIGITTSRSMEMRVGYQIGKATARIVIGADQPEPSGTEALFRSRVTFDRMDAPIVPSRGVRAFASADYYIEAPDADAGFGLATGSISAFQPLGARERVFGAFRAGTAFDRPAPKLYDFDIGGVFRLSSFERGRFRGQRFLQGTAGYMHQISRLPDFLGGPIYALGFLESATAYDDFDSAKWHASVSGGVVMETLFGPLLVAGAIGDEGSSKFYFVLGDLFR